MVEQVPPDEREAFSPLPTPGIWKAVKVVHNSPLVASVVDDENVTVSCERFP